MRQMEESNMTRIEPMELEIVSHFHPEAGYYPEEDSTSPQMTKEEWLEKISKLKKGALPFIKLFEKHEEEYMNNGSVRFHIWEDGTGYLEKLGDFSEIHLFKKTKGLGMVIPEDIGFETIGKYLKLNETIDVVNSFCGSLTSMTVKSLLNKFKVPFEERRSAFNLLSLEFSEKMPMLDEAVKLPHFVLLNSMIRRLEGIIGDKFMESGSENLKKKLESMPSYMKFLLLSMKNSYTDVHIDFSATSVFYHVHTGRKIFYVAPPTEENLKAYEEWERWEKGTEREVWLGKKLFDQWTRIEISAGQTLMMPSGFIHFVFTPEDCVVIGGNFLLDRFLKLQFRLSKLEESCLELYRTSPTGQINETHTFEGFRNVMWATIEFYLIPQLIENPKKKELIEMGMIFLEEMNAGQRISQDWYSEEEKKAILEKLKGVMPRVSNRRHLENLALEPVAKKPK